MLKEDEVDLNPRKKKCVKRPISKNPNGRAKNRTNGSKRSIIDDKRLRLSEFNVIFLIK